MKKLEKLWKYNSYFNCVNCCCDSFLDLKGGRGKLWDKYDMDRFGLGYKGGIESIGIQMENMLINELS